MQGLITSSHKIHGPKWGPFSTKIACAKMAIMDEASFINLNMNTIIEISVIWSYFEFSQKILAAFHLLKKKQIIKYSI